MDFLFELLFLFLCFLIAEMFRKDVYELELAVESSDDSDMDSDESEFDESEDDEEIEIIPNDPVPEIVYGPFSDLELSRIRMYNQMDDPIADCLRSSGKHPSGSVSVNRLHQLE